ncbi:MAG: hypothetical protein ACK48P_03455 [Holosporales bacterium]|jgi:hypothetical protein
MHRAVRTCLSLFVALLVLVAVNKVLHIAILIVGALLFGDGELTVGRIDSFGELVGLIGGVTLAMITYRKMNGKKVINAPSQDALSKNQLP